MNIEQLRNILSYDTEETKFLSLSERCEIHRGIAQLLNKKEPDLSFPVKHKIKQALWEIEQKGWKRPDIRIHQDCNGNIIKVINNSK